MLSSRYACPRNHFCHVDEVDLALVARAAKVDGDIRCRLDRISEKFPLAHRVELEGPNAVDRRFKVSFHLRRREPDRRDHLDVGVFERRDTCFSGH